MKRKIYTLLLAATVLISLHSCLNSDDDYTTYSDTAVTSFSLGTIKRLYHTTSSTGEDSTYTGSLYASSYVFHIDHQNKTIYNTDSLPLGTITSKSLVTLATKNGGSAYWNINDTLYAYSSTDSIDLSEPRTLVVYASNGVDYREYTVSVNVHQEDSSEVVYNQYVTQQAFMKFTQMDAVAANGYMYLFGTDGTTTEVYKTSIFDGNTWEQITPDITLQPTVANKVIYSNGYFYTLNGTDVIASADARNWTTAATGTNLSCIFGAASSEIYALANDYNIMVSTDKGQTWTADDFDESMKAQLPVEDLNCVVTQLKTDNDYERVMLVGRSNDADTMATVWTKLVNTTDDSKSEEWYKVERNQLNHYNYLPDYTSMKVMKCEDYLVGMGYDDEEDGISEPWFCYDHGLTWKKDTLYKAPDELECEGFFTAAIDDVNKIWIFCGGTGQVWSVRQNGVGWRSKDKEAALREQ